MKFNFQKELIIIIIALIPLAYLLYFWNTYPDTVPLHWNIKGEVDRMGSKENLILIPFLLPVLCYFVLTVAPLIDPKGKLSQMGDKYFNIKFLLTLLMSALALYILNSAKTQNNTNLNFVTVFIGLLFLLFGNYFQALKHNYFIGIRTPWTLNSEWVWKKTHSLAGKLWVVGGLCILCAGFVLNSTLNFIVFCIISGILVLIPLIYSFILYKKENSPSNH